MSVLIKDMQMPEDEETVTLTICADGLVFEEFKEPVDVFHAVHVPPHGRLIDADAMIHDIEKAITPSWYIKERNADMVKFLSLEDTIIPASEKEE